MKISSADGVAKIRKNAGLRDALDGGPLFRGGSAIREPARLEWLGPLLLASVGLSAGVFLLFTFGVVFFVFFGLVRARFSVFLFLTSACRGDVTTFAVVFFEKKTCKLISLAKLEKGAGCGQHG